MANQEVKNSNESSLTRKALDTISRQAAIDAMANTLWHYPNECYRNLSEYEFAKGLAELGLKSVPSAQPEQRWIPCSGTIDIPHHEVLCCDKYGEELIGWLSYVDDQWLCESDGEMMYDPVAWREKPEPYKEGHRMDDTISRQQTITALRALSGEDGYINAPHEVVTDVVRGLPPVQAEHEQTTRSEQTKTDKFGVKISETCEDCISRQAAIDVIKKHYRAHDNDLLELIAFGIEQLPSAQPEPLSDAYTKAVWTWLLEYQIKAAELKGRYTPYEVLSWVANDWRKEHEGSD